MLHLVARYADAWNWWGWDETHDETTERMTPIVATLEQECESIGRDPSVLPRTYDLYTVVPPGFSSDGSEMNHSIAGSADEIADRIVALTELGIAEARCDIYPKSVEAIAAMQPVIDLVHSA
jgi:alkanesulfonate monooxygenase SsuD/methylene tetrahydromethanopterin reductase-like flavin-dependent oxidoreductase (luciferase family)